MLLTHFSSISRNKWEVTAPVKSTKPIATISRRAGGCSATITTGHTINCEELAALLTFMGEREKPGA